MGIRYTQPYLLQPTLLQGSKERCIGRLGFMQHGFHGQYLPSAIQRHASHYQHCHTDYPMITANLLVQRVDSDHRVFLFQGTGSKILHLFVQ